MRLRRALLAPGLLAPLLFAGSAPAAAVAPPTAPAVAEQSVAECDEISALRTRHGKHNGWDPNDLSRAQAEKAQQQIEAKLRAKGLSASSKLPSSPRRVKVHWHVITRADGTGGVTNKQLAAQLRVLNEAFAGKVSQHDAPTIFRFVTASIDRTANDDWYDWGSGATPAEAEADFVEDDREAKKALHRGGFADLNVYVTALGGGSLLGYATFPFDTTLEGDGVVVLNESLPGGSVAPYNEGDTLTHEVGHWLGLFHTFENGCEPPGDWVPDTPYQDDEENIFFCDESLDTCPAPGKDPVHNYMSYGDDPCLDRFTIGQSVRMALIWFAYRA